MWGGERGHKGFTNGFTKRMHKRRQHNKHTPKDSQRIAQGDTKGFTKGITTAGPQRDHSGTTAGQQRAAGQPGQQRDNQDNTGTTTGQQRDNPGNSSTFFVAPMSCITRVSLSSGRPRAAQPHHLQRRLEESKDTMAEPVRANLAEPGHANLAKPGHANACNQCLVGLAGPIRLRGRHKVGTAGHRALARVRTAPIARGSVRR